MLQTLLVDDDILSLNKMQTFLADLDFIHVCGQLLDGTGAIEYLNTHGDSIDIVILDMEMPGASGLEVARFISKHQLPITILVISNYDNFEYVKPILQAGAYDYLLKHELSRTLLETKLSEIRLYIDKQQLHQKQWDQMCQLSKQQYLRNLVLNYDIPDENRHFFASDPLLCGRRHVAACLQITNFSSIYQSIPDERHQKVVNTVLHFCDTFFTSLQRGIITHINYGEFLVLLSFPDLTSEAAILQTASQDISLLKNNLRRYLSIHTFAESMPVFDSVEHLRPYYLKIHHRLQVKPFNSDSERPAEKEGNSVLLLSLQEENELSESLLHLNEKKVTEIVTHIFDTVGQTHVSLLGLQRLVLRLTEIMQLALRTASQDRETITVPPPAVNNILDIEALKKQFLLYYRQGLERLASASVSQYPPLIQKALNYIYQNYHLDLSLSDISRHCGVSEVYFSRAFKDALGLPFTKYLNAYRVRIAAHLLRQSNDSLKKIAEESGFQSYNYFLTVFKTYMGVTPVQYREKSPDTSTD